MGGFIVDVSHLHNTLSRLTISTKGLAFLAKHGHFVNIPDAAIRDKSKADWLAKALVCELDAGADDCSKNCWVSHNVIGSPYLDPCRVCYSNVRPLVPEAS